MRVLVTGDREWDDYAIMDVALTALSPKKIIEGEARGADRLSKAWGYNNIGRNNVIAVKADWDRWGKRAGPIRNSQMLDEQPDVVVAFHDNYERSKGTKDMVEKAMHAGLPVWFITSRTNIIWNFNDDDSAIGITLGKAQINLSQYQSQLA